jgi:hypothetical protein
LAVAAGSVEPGLEGFAAAAGFAGDAGFAAGLAAAGEAGFAVERDAVLAAEREAVGFAPGLAAMEATGAAGEAGFAVARDAVVAASRDAAGFAARVEAGLPPRGEAGFAVVRAAVLAAVDAPVGRDARLRDVVRFAAALRCGVARPVGTAAAFAAAPFAAPSGVVRAVADFGAPGAPARGGLVPAAGGETVSSFPPRRSTPRPADTTFRPAPTTESIRFIPIRAVCPQRETLCGERARTVRHGHGQDVHVAAGDRQRLGGREPLPHGAAGGNPQRARDPAGQGVDVEAQLQLVREEILSSLPRCVHVGQYFRGRAGKEVMNERGASHQVEVFRGLERVLATEVIGALRSPAHGVQTPSAEDRYRPAG